MCGIVAYTGSRSAVPILLDGLTALEYRGYDSAGLVTSTRMYKEVGNVAALRACLDADTSLRKKGKEKKEQDTAGIAHTRWATHGEPTKVNAHPHAGRDERVWLVHNGIIENYLELKQSLEAAGHSFRSDTDSEVLAHLIESHYTKKRAEKHTLAQAVTEALAQVRGTYGIAVFDRKQPSEIVVARMGSPLLIGVGAGEYVIASDASAVIRHTRDIVYLNDGEYAIVSPSNLAIYSLSHEKKTHTIDHIDWALEDVQKQGYEHFMLKEIMEGPEVLRASARGRIKASSGDVVLGGLAEHADALRGLSRLVIVACGTAYYAGCVGKRLIEELAGIPVEVEVASEFRHRRLLYDRNTAVLAVTQSGETADTLWSIREAKKQGLLTLGVVNTVGSTIARETDAGVYNHAGPEIGVASTKAFLSQIEVLAMIAVYLGRMRGLSEREGKALVAELLQMPDLVAEILTHKDAIKEVATHYADATNMLYIGRHMNAPVALEGALKLKEISYLHAEGYPAGEMKHGPIAMIEPSFPTLAIAPRDSVYDKMVSAIEEIRARKGPVIAVVTRGDTELAGRVDAIMEVPETHELLSPLLTVVPLQLFAYYVGVARGYNVDRPRNLAKSVTVE